MVTHTLFSSQKAIKLTLLISGSILCESLSPIFQFFFWGVHVDESPCCLKVTLSLAGPVGSCFSLFYFDCLVLLQLKSQEVKFKF